MSQAGGNRARFFAPQPQIPDTSGVSSLDRSTSSHNGNFLAPQTMPVSEKSNIANNSVGALVPLSHQKSLGDMSNLSRSVSATDYSEDEIIAQRTRTIETETLFKATKERNGKLNISGLIKRKNTDVDPAVQTSRQTANITEIAEDDLELGTRSPHQHAGSRQISKDNILSPYTSPHFTSPPPQKHPHIMPPSNQLANFKTPLHHFDASTEDMSGMNQSSRASQSDIVNSHIPGRLFSSVADDSIKSLTHAFNKKHSAGSKPTIPRYGSPVPDATLNGRGGRLGSSRISFRDDAPPTFPGAIVTRNNIAENQAFSAGHENDFDEIVIQEPPRYNAQERHVTQNSHENMKRGEKRTIDSGAENATTHAPPGKRARTEAYDEPLPNHATDFVISNSSEPEVVENQHASFKRAISQDRSDVIRQDPQLKMFLGHDVDEYVTLHMERYEAAKKHWTQCTREEWEMGANELAEKFNKVLDFVKEHVKQKVALYASLHAGINEHQKRRKETAEMLKNAKNKLVAKTGIVVDDGKL